MLIWLGVALLSIWRIPNFVRMTSGMTVPGLHCELGETRQSERGCIIFGFVLSEEFLMTAKNTFGRGFLSLVCYKKVYYKRGCTKRIESTVYSFRTIIPDNGCRVWKGTLAIGFGVYGRNAQSTTVSGRAESVRKHGALRPQKPLRLTRNGEVGGSGIFISNAYPLHCHHQNDSALKWAAVWAILMFH